MKRLALSFLTFSLFWLVLLQSRQTAQESPLVIIHATVIDGTGAEAGLEQTVVIKGHRIAAMGKAGEVFIPKGARVVDATGKFLIPGLWDMHVHTLQEGRPKEFFPLLILNGVTGVRDMGSPMGDLQAITMLRKQIDGGEIMGPGIVAAGPFPGRTESDVSGALHSCLERDGSAASRERSPKWRSGLHQGVFTASTGCILRDCRRIQTTQHSVRRSRSGIRERVGGVRIRAKE